MLRLALLGDPVDHSRSPAIHRAALRHLEIPGEYVAQRSETADVVAAVARIRAGDLDGANITMPLKGAAVEAADEVAEVARRAGAANTLWFDGERVQATNTDVGGVRDVWSMRTLPDDMPVLVLGSGGAAAGALLAVESRDVRVSARRPDAARLLLERVGVVGEVVEWGSPVAGAVVVNATPLGMGGETLPEPVVAEASGLLDLAYGASPTPAVVAMTDRPVGDGIDVLVAQAARSFEIWTGRDAPRAVMEEAARALAPGF